MTALVMGSWPFIMAACDTALRHGCALCVVLSCASYCHVSCSHAGGEVHRGISGCRSTSVTKEMRAFGPQKTGAAGSATHRASVMKQVPTLLGGRYVGSNLLTPPPSTRNKTNNHAHMRLIAAKPSVPQPQAIAPSEKRLAQKVDGTKPTLASDPANMNLSGTPSPWPKSLRGRVRHQLHAFSLLSSRNEYSTGGRDRALSDAVGAPQSILVRAQSERSQPVLLETPPSNALRRLRQAACFKERGHERRSRRNGFRAARRGHRYRTADSSGPPRPVGRKMHVCCHGTHAAHVRPTISPLQGRHFAARATRHLFLATAATLVAVGELPPAKQPAAPGGTGAGQMTMCQ